MRRFSREGMPSLSVIATLLMAGALSMSTFGCAPVDAGADPLVVNAERSIQMSFETVDAFLKFDHANRDTLKVTAPDVHAFAEKTRIVAPALFNEAWAALSAYKAVQTPASGDTLDDALSKVESIARTARLFLLRVNPPDK